MSITTTHLRALAVMLVATPGLCRGAWGVQAGQTARAGVLGNVNQALAASDSGKFAQARRNLERSLAACPAASAGRECRILYTSGLGSLLYRQAAVDRRNRDSLYKGAVAYYDRILREAPENSEAIYGKALSYRALGPHEWMEPFFQRAPIVDRGRSAVYYTFLGDYYAAGQRWPKALEAYKQAVKQDADEDGARSGLIDALAALGRTMTGELLRYARDWQVRYPGSAADAYRAVLTGSFGRGAEPDAAADDAVVGLVWTQSRNGLTVGDVPAGVKRDWTPVRELQGFLRTSQPTEAPWWMKSSERSAALAQAALAAGRAAVSQGNYQLAEQMWTGGVGLVPSKSTISLDLRRELALLYLRQPTLDPGQHKFDSLEQDIFHGKAAALESGDLEASQRFHTTLGLIYAERGIWKSRFRAHNAEDQLTWGLEKAEERWYRQKFYQPLPELRLLLAQGLESLGNRAGAAQRYAEAAAAFLDTDELGAADSAVRSAERMGGVVTGPRQVLTLRSALGGGGAAAAACTAEKVASISGAGRADFVGRQQFKVLADCARNGPADRRRGFAIAALRLVDSAGVDSGGVTLVGGGDLARLQRVMTTLLDPFEVSFQPAHLDPAPAQGGPYIKVSLPGETRLLWQTAALDDVIAARVVAELGSSVKPFPMVVSGGVLSVPPTARVPPEVLTRVKRVPGIRGVQARNYY